MVEPTAEENAPEKLIAALKYLVYQCGNHGLPDYGQIIDSAAEECVKLMLHKGAAPEGGGQRPH